MDFKWKRRVTYVTIAIMFVFTGVEYAVVFPTIWEYLQRLGARNANILGLSIAAFSVSPMLVEPMVGKWFDRTQNAKLITAVMNVFEIIGSFLYFVGISPWFIALSRFICGIGSSAGTAVMADISRSTSVEERTAILANFQACRQIGLLIGPAFNLILRQLHFRLGPFMVNKLTAPGIFMAVIRVIMEVLFLTLYYNLTALSNVEHLTESLHVCYTGERVVRTYQGLPVVESDQSCTSLNDDRNEDLVEVGESVPSHIGSIGESSIENAECRDIYKNRPLFTVDHLRKAVCHGSTSCDLNEMIRSADRFMGSTVESSVHTSSDCSKSEDEFRPFQVEVANSCNDDSISPSIPENVNMECLSHTRWQSYVNEFLRAEVIALLGLTFVTIFAQMSLETVVTPLTKQYFNFDDFENSLFFLFAGIEILCTFLLISILSKRLQDRTLILGGTLMMLFSLCWYLIFVPCFRPGSWTGLPYFVVGVFVNLFGIAFLAACCTSLYSKLISSDNQGLGHGIRRTMQSLGMILGPLWGGTTVHEPMVLFSIPLVVVSLFMVLFCASFGSLKVHKEPGNVVRNCVDDETTPLLKN